MTNSDLEENLNNLTVYDCINIYIRDGLRFVINDGKIINLVKE